MTSYIFCAYSTILTSMEKLSKKILMVCILVFGSALNAAEPNTLFAHKWGLLIINNQALRMDRFSERKPYIEFKTDNTFSAYIGCNQIHGSFTFTAPDSIQFATNMAMTKMACDEYFMGLEDEFVATLPKVKYVDLQDEKVLKLLDAEKITRLIFTNVVVY